MVQASDLKRKRRRSRRRPVDRCPSRFSAGGFALRSPLPAEFFPPLVESLGFGCPVSSHSFNFLVGWLLLKGYATRCGCPFTVLCRISEIIIRIDFEVEFGRNRLKNELRPTIRKISCEPSHPVRASYRMTRFRKTVANSASNLKSCVASRTISNWLDWLERSGRHRSFIWQPPHGCFPSLSKSR